MPRTTFRQPAPLAPTFAAAVKRATLLVAVSLATIPSLVLAQEYRTKSFFNRDYKCVADEAGGFKHGASGHDLVRFKPHHEFFLTHVSNLPMNLARKMFPSLSRADEASAREYIEKILMKQETKADSAYFTESGSYFIREPEVNPEDVMATMNRCEVRGFKNGSTGISCYGSLGKTFEFAPSTGRFTYSYSGTWHDEVKDNYYGDSSVFVFGSCKEYYR